MSLILLVLTLLPQEPTPFTPVTRECGVQKIVAEKYAALPDWWLSGLHLVDLDGDGDLDLFLSAHGPGGAVAALNDGSGRFSPAPGTIPPSEIHLAYDLDEDGRLDLAMTYQDGGGQWWRNASKPGELKFTALPITRGTNTARRQAVIDIDRDGRADWLRGLGTGIHFDLSDGAGGFAAKSAALSVASGKGEVLCLPVDLDGDGDCDLVTEWGHYQSASGNSRLFRNDGDLKFTDITAEAGLTSEGAAIKGAGDVDQDGDADLIVLENRAFPPAIFLNDGKGRFSRHADAVSGLRGTASMASWGVAVVIDLDNDGMADLLMNGKHFLKVLRGTGQGKFASVNADWGIRDTSASSVDDGLCFGDIDGDGDLDLVGYRSIHPKREIDVYRNDLPRRNWIRVRPIGKPGNRGAAGAKIRIADPETKKLLWYEQVAIYDSQAAQSYYGLAPTERHFGLGDRTTVDVTVEFHPSGKVVEKRGAPAGKAVEIPEESP